MTKVRAAASILFFALCLSAFAFGQDDDVIKVDSSMVVLNALIIDADGLPVNGLTREQFRVFEDGKEQPISFFAAEETPFAAVILLDTSGSMEQRVTLARSAAIAFLDGLRTSDVAAIYRFDSKVELVQGFSNSRDVAERFFDLKARGMTALNDALYQAAQDLAGRPEKRRAIIVLSDGEDNFSGRSGDKALKAALAADASIYTVDMSAVQIGAAKRVQNQGVLKNFAERSGGTFIATPGGAAMRSAFKTIVEELGQQYTVGYQPANSAADGKWRALELRVSRPNLKIRTRRGYYAARS